MHAELHNFCFSSSMRAKKSRWMVWACPVTRMGEKRKACCILVGKSKGMRSHVRRNEITRTTWYKWENNIKMKMNGLKGCGLYSSG